MRFLQWLRGDRYRFGIRADPRLFGDDEPAAPDPEIPTWVVSFVCGILLVVHLSVKTLFGTIKDRLDIIALGLIVVGLSPWLATIIKSLKVGGVEVNFQEVEKKIDQQGDEIKRLKFLITHLIPEWEYQHLASLASSEPFIVNLDQTPREFESELRHLRAMGFIYHKNKFSISEFAQKGERVKNVSEYFGLTDSGRELLDYRRDDERPPPVRLGSQAASIVQNS